MPEPLEPDRTADAGTSDARPSAAYDGDETATAVPRPGAATPTFGPPAAPGEVGELGPYRVLKELGKGGMGAVYLARDTRLDRPLALKVMLPAFAADRDAKERFLREARAAAKVNHDNVVTVYEADERNGVPYIAMQFLQGMPLDDYLKHKGVPPLAHVIRIGREAALGLSAAHALGLVHRDIKPANLWLEAPNGRVKVLDFGLAKPIGGDTEVTKSGAVVGTPAYMSPEQARGAKVDSRTDVFSLGAVLYRLCTGKTPFAGPNVMAVMMALGTEDPTPVRELNPSVPEPLAELIHQLLAKKPEQRPQTAAEVAKRLQGILSGLFAPPGPSVASSGSAPAVSSADVSVSQPVVVHAVPHQPPVVVPMHVTAVQESVFANLGDDASGADATAAEPAPAAAKPERKTGGTGVLFAAGGVVLAAVAVAAVVVLQMGQKKAEPAATAPDAGTTGVEKGKPDPKAPDGPPAFKNSIGMEFVKVPKGTGWLGGGAGKPGDTRAEFKQDFYLGKYKVTQDEWEKVIGTNPSHFSRTGGGRDAVKDISDADLRRFPVEMVSWDDCQEFIRRLNEKAKDSGWVYRLPTEAEWEYACRGGPIPKADSAFDYYFAKPTNALLPTHANFNANLGRTCKVGSYEPNVLGLHDMHGNVSEWCDDVVMSGDRAGQRMSRAGAWSFESVGCRVVRWDTGPPSFRAVFLGLRLARVPSAPAGK
jgi:serine/threonine protein kinase/formylglycine-generating enzyme required for sulfatase activity